VPLAAATIRVYKLYAVSPAMFHYVIVMQFAYIVNDSSNVLQPILNNNDVEV